MRILGLDYGERRIGVAVCDELAMTAQAVATIIRKNRRHDLEEIARLIKTYGIEEIVIGYPLRLDGTEGIQCEKVSRFSRILETTFSLPVIKWDETLSTKEAEDILAAAGVRRKKKKQLNDPRARVGEPVVRT